MSLPAAAKAGALAVSVAVAAAIAVYESPDLRRYTDDVRRRVALALHNMGEGINPPEREPMFNRPEDAHGFLQSRRGAGAEPGVDADEESRRRQREELMYWNAVHMEKKSREQKEDPTQSQPESHAPPTTRPRGSTFDDFLKQDDQSGERGTFVFNTGAEVQGSGGGEGVRRRHDGVRGLNAVALANPFADEHQIDRDEMASSPDANTEAETKPEPEPEPDISPAKDDAVSDIYSATTRDPEELTTREERSAPTPPLVDISSNTEFNSADTPRSQTLERELGPDEYMTAGQDDRVSGDAFASIQAWAQNSGTPTGGDGFYSPLPMSPDAPMSEPEMVSEGVLTPTDSVSLVGSGEDVANDATSSRNGDDQNARPYDVLSESSGIMTPASWSEIGSVVSEEDRPAPVPAS